MTGKQVRQIRREGNLAYVTLTKGYEAVIDAFDVPLIDGENNMSHHSDFDPWQEPTPKVDWVTKDDADRKASRRLWAGIICTAAICGILSALGWM